MQHEKIEKNVGLMLIANRDDAPGSGDRAGITRRCGGGSKLEFDRAVADLGRCGRHHP